MLKESIVIKIVNDKTCIRHSKISDATLLLPLMEEFGYPQSLKAMQDKLEIYNGDSNCYLIVVEIGKKIIGFIAFSFYRLFALQYKIAKIDALVVSEQYRRKGIGRKLMKHMEKIAKEKGCKSIELLSSISRKSAHPFYESLGYMPDKSTLYIKKDL